MPSPLNRFSRRAFLQLSATLSAGVGIGRGQWSNPSAAADSPTLGRTFGLTTAYARPALNSAVNGSLAPYSVHDIQDRGTWYRTELGFVPRTAMQPITAYQPPVIETRSATPFWAEVIAPISSSREWCSAKAPIAVTWGHGAVTRILGTLTDDYGVVWYETSRGWFDGRQWQRVALPKHDEAPTNTVTVQIDPNWRQITIWHEGRARWQTAYYGGIAVGASLTTFIQTETPGDGSGSGWLMRLDNGIVVRGACDHNSFGLAGGGAEIELPIRAAKRLYMEIACCNPQPHSIGSST